MEDLNSEGEGTDTALVDVQGIDSDSSDSRMDFDDANDDRESCSHSDSPGSVGRSSCSSDDI